MADAPISQRHSNAASDALQSSVDSRPPSNSSIPNGPEGHHTTGTVTSISGDGWPSAISAGAIAFVTSIAAQWLIYDHWLGGRGVRLADPSIAAVAVALFVKHLRQTEHKNKLADLRRFEVIRQMNHHIRNALHVLAYQPFLPDGSSEMAQQAIKRIEWVLTEVLPAVRDEELDK